MSICHVPDICSAFPPSPWLGKGSEPDLKLSSSVQKLTARSLCVLLPDRSSPPLINSPLPVLFRVRRGFWCCYMVFQPELKSYQILPCKSLLPVRVHSPCDDVRWRNAHMMRWSGEWHRHCDLASGYLVTFWHTQKEDHLLPDRSWQWAVHLTNHRRYTAGTHVSQTRVSYSTFSF